MMLALLISPCPIEECVRFGMTVSDSRQKIVTKCRRLSPESRFVHETCSTQFLRLHSIHAVVDGLFCSRAKLALRALSEQPYRSPIVTDFPNTIEKTIV